MCFGLLHVFHVFFGMPCMCIRMSCMCSSACPACARRHALHVLLNLLFCSCMHCVSGYVCLSLRVPLSLSACLCVLAYLCFIVRLSVCLSVILSVCLPLCLYVSVFLQLHLHGVHLCLSFLLTFLSCSHFSCLQSFLFTFLPFPHFLRCLVTGSRDAILKLKNKYAAMGSCLILLI